MTPQRPMMPTRPKAVKRYPIHDTSGGVNHGSIAERCFTQNPIPEGTRFEVHYGGCIIQLRLDHHFYCDEKVSLVELISVSTLNK